MLGRVPERRAFTDCGRRTHKPDLFSSCHGALTPLLDQVRLELECWRRLWGDSRLQRQVVERTAQPSRCVSGYLFLRVCPRYQTDFVMNACSGSAKLRVQSEPRASFILLDKANALIFPDE